MFELLDPQVNIPRAVEQTVTAAIFAGLAKSTHLIVLAQAAKIALLMVNFKLEWFLSIDFKILFL